MPQQKFNQPMSFLGHIDEFRKRLIRCLWLFLIAFGLCYTFSDFFLAFLRKPLFENVPPEYQKIYFTHLFENFLTHLKVSVYAGFLIISPYCCYEFWGFVSPGLYPKERRFIIPLIFFAVFFFIGGASFAYWVLLPVAFKYFIHYGSPDTEMPLITMDGYYGTCMKLLLLFGLAFELPVLVCVFGYFHLVDASFLRQHRKTAILLITVLSALFAPPDALSMIILGVPLVLLYEMSILVVQWLGRKRKRKWVEGEISSLEGKSR